ncbi:S1 family peptidase [Sinosporangium siamense]|nr:S1 family peptidase [Sinosporangium siamense]
MRIAKENKEDLSSAIDRYVAQKVAADPSVTANNPDRESVQPDVFIDGIPLSELTDLKLIARTEKISYEEAINRYAWIPSLDKVAASIRKTYPEEAAGLAIVNDGRGLIVGFKGKIPDDAVNLARTLPVEVKFIGNKGFSEEELKRTLEHAHHALATREDLAKIAGEYDIETGEISFLVRPEVALRNERDRQGLEARLLPSPPVNPNIRFKLTVTDADIAVPVDGYIRGGGLQNFEGVCTSGFNITNGTGRRATTANHCRDINSSGLLRYNNHPTQGGGTDTSAQTRSTYYDIASYSVGLFTGTRTFYYDWNLPRYVDDFGISPTIGQRVCKFGRTTGADCSTIDSVNATRTYAGRTYHAQIVTDARITDGGDSGGPWYFGNRAWGFSAAKVDPWIGDLNGESTFSPAYLIPSALGAAWSIYER